MSHKLKTDFNIQLVLQWIPGHTNIHGNDKADTLAKKGSRLEQHNKSAPINTTKQIIRHIYKEKWMDMWAEGTTGRVVYNHMNSVKPDDSINQLNRKGQTSIFRLRTGHLPLNFHLNTIKPTHPPMCLLCDHAYETVEHLLFRCPALQDIRRQLLPPFPSIDNTLYSSPQQLNNTTKYYYMALGRRAHAQRLLD